MGMWMLLAGALLGALLTMCGVMLWAVLSIGKDKQRDNGYVYGFSQARVPQENKPKKAVVPTYDDALRAAEMANFWNYDGGEQPRAEEVAADTMKRTRHATRGSEKG